MYINDVHILYYVLAGIIGIIMGSFINWCNYAMPKDIKVLSKEIFQKTKKIKANYILPIIIAVLYIVLLYFFGIHKDFYANLNLIKFALLLPMLISALVIDYKHQIIPNRLNLTMFEIGLILTFIYGIVNINIAKDMLFGMFAGGGIFLVIT